MIDILTWVSIITGGLLILFMLLSLLGGLDLDFDIGDTDVDADSGGLGLMKGFLTFVAVSAWVIRILLISNQSPVIATVIGLISGLLAYLLLHYLFRLLLRNEENVNWSVSDAMFQKGEVYLRIPAKGNGLVHIDINGVLRELKDKSADHNDILTGTSVVVVDIDEDYAIVQTDE